MSDSKEPSFSKEAAISYLKKWSKDAKCASCNFQLQISLDRVEPIEIIDKYCEDCSKIYSRLCECNPKRAAGYRNEHQARGILLSCVFEMRRYAGLEP